MGYVQMLYTILMEGKASRLKLNTKLIQHQLQRELPFCDKGINIRSILLWHSLRDRVHVC